MRRGGVFLGKKEAFQVGFSIREEVPREREKVRGEFISLGKTEEGNGGDIFERMTQLEIEKSLERKPERERAFGCWSETEFLRGRVSVQLEREVS